MAKALIAALGALAITANLIERAHGFSHVDWVPIAAAWSTALGVFAYPNVTVPPKAP